MADSFLKSLQRILTGGAPLYQLIPGVSFAGPVFAGAIQVLVPAATLTPNLLLGRTFQVTFAANTVVAFQVPTGVPAGVSCEFAITIINTSGGALTNTTFAAGYKQAAFTYPATAKQRTYTFYTDGTTAWEITQTAADVAN